MRCSITTAATIPAPLLLTHCPGDEVEEVFGVLAAHGSLAYELFDYYAGMGIEPQPVHNGARPSLMAAPHLARWAVWRRGARLRIRGAPETPRALPLTPGCPLKDALRM